MSRLLTLALVLGVALFAFANAPTPEGEDAQAKTEETKLQTDDAKLSYMIGHSFGEYLKDLPAELDMKALMAGIEHGRKGADSLLSEQEAEALRHSFAQKAQEALAKRQAEQARKNLAEGQAFLEANKAEEGVQTTESGLQYKVLEPGDGPRPGPQDSVTVHYRGTLLDGETFDSSYDRGEPITFPLDGVIQGWSEGVQLMRVGAKHRLFIPPDLGYGDRGPSPNAVLIFDVELLGIGDEEPPQMQMDPQQELTPEQRRQLEQQMEQLRRQQQQ